jgi:hypothetical protein
MKLHFELVNDSRASRKYPKVRFADNPLIDSF